jgi:hypothetical protein
LTEVGILLRSHSDFTLCPRLRGAFGGLIVNPQPYYSRRLKQTECLRE